VVSPLVMRSPGEVGVAKRRIASLTAISPIIVMAVASNAGFTSVQGQTSQVISLQAVRHPVSLPLSFIRPAQAATGFHWVTPWLLTQPALPQRLIVRVAITRREPWTAPLEAILMKNFWIQSKAGQGGEG